MGGTAFVVHWLPEELQDRVLQVEAYGWRVVGAEGQDLERAARGILETRPGIVVVWLTHRHDDARLLVLKAKTADPSMEFAFVFVDGPDRARSLVEEVCPAGIFTPVQRLEGALREAERTALRMQKVS